MSDAHLGWYVHHHGLGHLARFLAIRPHLEAVVTVFSSLPPPARLDHRTTWVLLPRDDDEWKDGFGSGGAGDDGRAAGARRRSPASSSPTAHGRLHWAPLGHPGHRRRLTMIADAAGPLDAMVVDVSVEIAAFTRLLGLPLVLVTQPGIRDDDPHRLAFDLADRIICPWPPGLHRLDHFGAARDRLREVGAVSRFGGGRARADAVTGRVLVLGALGSVDAAPRIWRDLTGGLPDLEWTSAGFLPASHRDDPWPTISTAEFVISGAGQNSVADVAAAGRRLIVVPQDRPFGEQRATAKALARSGTATMLDGWPAIPAVAAAIESSRRSEPDWSRWGADRGAVSAAEVVAEVLA